MAHACRLYLITPPSFALEAFCPALTEALGAGDIACVQYRPKGIPDTDIVAAVDRLRPLVQDRDIALILNDRPDLAARTGCDGVHIGQEDASYEDARRLVGADAIVGVTCHNSRHLAMVAAEEGADYVAFGAFFPTETKQPMTCAEPELLRWWSELTEVPCVAIGGITPRNCATLVRAGADFLAVSGAVWNCADGPAAAVQALNRAISEA